MDIFSSFKDTALGPLPEVWDVVPLQKVTLKTNTKDPRNTPNEPFRYIDVSSVSNEKFCLVGWKDYMGKDAPSRARKVVKTGDIVFATVRPYLKNIAKILGEFDNQICSTGYCVIRANEKVVDANYLFYVALSESFVSNIVAHQRGSSYPAVSDEVVFNTPIPLPPLPEQRAIARVLTTVREAIEATDRVLIATRELKRSLMHHLFTYGPVPVNEADQVALKETEIGEVPEGWEVTTIGPLCEAGGGKVQIGPFGSLLHADDYVQEGIPSVMPQDMVNNRIVEDQIARITLKDHQRLSKYHLQAGDIVYARRGDIGRRAIVGIKQNGWLCGTGSLFIRVGEKSEVLPDYLFNYLGLQKVIDIVVSRAVGTTMLNLNGTIVASIPVIYPEFAHQKEIARSLEAVEEKMIAETQRKTALESLFQSLLHHLMTGKIRAGQ